MRRTHVQELCTVYLLHFDRPISERHTCQHYLGSAEDLVKRLRKHREDPDARLLQVAKERGIGFTVARIWTNRPREFERQLKNQKSSNRLCPICQREHGQLDLFLEFELIDVNELAF